MISYFRPPSVTESGEAALRRLLASRAIGGYSLSSGYPAPGSPSVFQSSRVARPQDSSKALDLVSLLSSSARLYVADDFVEDAVANRRLVLRGSLLMLVQAIDIFLRPPSGPLLT